MGKDKGHEFVRIRTRKGGDKDRDSDTQSTTGSTITSLKERKHRKSVTSSTSPTDSKTSTVCANETPDQLPALSENEESEFVSANTSPILRTRSNELDPKRSSPLPPPQTPANLQPYLEDSDDAVSTAVPPNQVAESEEWIGPRIDHESSSNDTSDLTPTPGPQHNPLGRPPHASRAMSSRPSSHIGASLPTSEVSAEAKKSFLDSNMIYSWSSGDKETERFYYPSQMSNPFLPTAQALPSLPEQAPLPSQPTVPQASTYDEANENASAGQIALPKPTGGPMVAPSEIADSQSIVHHGKKIRTRPEMPQRESRREYPPPAQIEYAPHSAQSSPPQDALIHQPVMGPMAQMPTAFSPVPMHHTQSNPLPYPGVPARFDHPSNILHRVGNALPDIAALMDIYHGTCSITHAREQHIRELEAQKQIEAERQNKRIDALTRDIEAMIRDRKAQERRLRDDIDHLQRKNQKLQENLAREVRHAESVMAAKSKADQTLERMKQEYQEHIEHVLTTTKQEKERMVAIHEGDRQNLLDRMAQAAANAENHHNELQKRHASEMGQQEDRWHQHLKKVEATHTETKTELEASLHSAQNDIDTERQRQNQLRESFEKEQSDWEEQRHSLETKARDELHKVQTRHRSENDTLQADLASARTLHSSIETELIKEQKYKKEIQDELGRALAFHKAEIDRASESFRKEKDDYTRDMEAAAARRLPDKEAWTVNQQTDEAHAETKESPNALALTAAKDTIAQLRKENEELKRTRGPSQSRHLSEANELLARLRKENETLKGERLRPIKTEPTPSSRSSTPAPKEERLERTRSNRTSGLFSGSSVFKSREEDGHRHRRDRTS